MKPHKINTQLDGAKTESIGILSGWLQGKLTYLWVGDKSGNFVGTLSGHKLYRLAKAIVRQFDNDE